MEQNLPPPSQLKKKVSSVWGLFHVENSQDPKNSRINFDLPL